MRSSTDTRLLLEVSGGTGATTRQAETGDQQWRREREQGPVGAGIDKVVTDGMEARRRPAADDRLAVR